MDLHPLELRWHTTWSKPKRNPNGTSGYATVVRSRTATPTAGETIRIHVCAHKPCRAQHPVSKYGIIGPPLHVELFEGTGDAMFEAPLTAAVAAPAPADLAATTHAEEEDATAVRMPEPPPLPPPGAPPLPPEGTSVQDLEPPGPPDSPSPPPPAPPLAASLRPVPAAPPTLADAPGGGTTSGPAVADEEAPNIELGSVLQCLLRLAREIRRPRAYIGYSMFVHLALARSLRVYSWEGSSRVDFVTDYIPWALERCTNTCPVDVVCCCLEQRDGLPRMMPVSEEHPLSECRHFVAEQRSPPSLAPWAMASKIGTFGMASQFFLVF